MTTQFKTFLQELPFWAVMVLIGWMAILVISAFIADTL